jgi:hypothetical protein
MADNNIKKVIILKKDLPQFYGSDQEYVVKYRIITEDKNRTSHWSPNYKLPVAPVTAIDYRIAVEQSHDMINAVWTPNSTTKSEFDIYVKWDSDPWQFISTVFTTSYSTIIKSGAAHFQLAVQVPTFPKERFSGATLFESTQINV